MVIHHMILSGCNQDMRHVKESYNCIMGNAKCQEPLGGWTVGAEGKQSLSITLQQFCTQGFGTSFA